MTVAPTLSLDGAINTWWDVIVVGAGPAGSLAARELARQGVSVLLVDKASFPRWKVCGSCLNVRALSILSGVGLAGLCGRLGAVPLCRLKLAAGGRQALIRLLGGVAISRENFDAALVEAAIQAGTAFLPQTQASLGVSFSGGRQVMLRQAGRDCPAVARLVVAANGLGGTLLAGEAEIEAAPASRLGAGTIVSEAPAFYRGGTIFMACAAGGYVGLVRLEDNRLDIAAALDPKQVKEAGGPGPAAASILHAAGFPPVPAMARSLWRGTPLLTRRLRLPASDRVLVLGDAAGYVEPFTGEGMAWALGSAVAVAPLAWQACRHWQPELAHRWSSLYHQIVGPRQRTCRIVARVLRRPALTQAAIAVLAKAPGLAFPLVRYFSSLPGLRGERLIRRLHRPTQGDAPKFASSHFCAHPRAHSLCGNPHPRSDKLPACRVLSKRTS